MIKTKNLGKRALAALLALSLLITVLPFTVAAATDPTGLAKAHAADRWYMLATGDVTVTVKTTGASDVDTNPTGTQYIKWELDDTPYSSTNSGTFQFDKNMANAPNNVLLSATVEEATGIQLGDKVDVKATLMSGGSTDVPVGTGTAVSFTVEVVDSPKGLVVDTEGGHAKAIEISAIGDTTLTVATNPVFADSTTNFAGDATTDGFWVEWVKTGDTATPPVVDLTGTGNLIRKVEVAALPTTATTVTVTATLKETTSGTNVNDVVTDNNGTGGKVVYTITVKPAGAPADGLKAKDDVVSVTLLDAQAPADSATLEVVYDPAGNVKPANSEVRWEVKSGGAFIEPLPSGTELTKLVTAKAEGKAVVEAALYDGPGTAATVIGKPVSFDVNVITEPTGLLAVTAGDPVEIPVDDDKDFEVQLAKGPKATLVAIPGAALPAGWEVVWTKDPNDTTVIATTTFGKLLTQTVTASDTKDKTGELIAQLKKGATDVGDPVVFNVKTVEASVAPIPIGLDFASGTGTGTSATLRDLELVLDDVTDLAVNLKFDPAQTGSALTTLPTGWSMLWTAKTADQDPKGTVVLTPADGKATTNTSMKATGTVLGDATITVQLFKTTAQAAGDEVGTELKFNVKVTDSSSSGLKDMFSTVPATGKVGPLVSFGTHSDTNKRNETLAVAFTSGAGMTAIPAGHAIRWTDETDYDKFQSPDHKNPDFNGEVGPFIRLQSDTSKEGEQISVLTKPSGTGATAVNGLSLGIAGNTTGTAIVSAQLVKEASGTVKEEAVSKPVYFSVEVTNADQRDPQVSEVEIKYFINSDDSFFQIWVLVDGKDVGLKGPEFSGKAFDSESWALPSGISTVTLGGVTSVTAENNYDRLPRIAPGDEAITAVALRVHTQNAAPGNFDPEKLSIGFAKGITLGDIFSTASINQFTLDPDAVPAISRFIYVPVDPRPLAPRPQGPVPFVPAHIPSGSIVNNSPAPGSPAFVLTTALSASSRVLKEIRAGINNDSTGEAILAQFSAAMPTGVTVAWSKNAPFRLVPATATSEGRATGTLLMTVGTGTSAFPINVTIPRVSE